MHKSAAAVEEEGAEEVAAFVVEEAVSMPIEATPTRLVHRLTGGVAFVFADLMLPLFTCFSFNSCGIPARAIKRHFHCP